METDLGSICQSIYFNPVPPDGGLCIKNLIDLAIISKNHELENGHLETGYTKVDEIPVKK
ncbi:hypothetical protein LAD12857_39380 [Lacrimispora amygdalina]|uniref:Uncharacterized protein n=1 Tax=Lacrimispora amygdalina TaxID=253257 RepID=A0ABQ5MB15_9FIRM